ncbi:MAG: amidohydrolase family protein [Acidimicrobiales bacterium]
MRRGATRCCGFAAGVSLYSLRDTTENPVDVLNRAIPDRPALILDDLGHAVWTNTRGLIAAGIGPDDPDPQGGVLHRDRDGRLTGLLLEDAQQAVRNAAAQDDDAYYNGLLVAQEFLAEAGVTTISDAGGYWAQNHPAAFERALAEGTLTVRAMNTLYVYPALDVDEQLAEFERRFANDSDMLRFDTAKIYIDGILDLGTALLLEPYDEPLDANYPSGFSYFQPEQLRTYVNELSAMGYRMNFHVIGDAAARTALDAIEAIDDDPDAIADRRHRTTHTYMVDEADIPRFAELGVIADFQQSEDATTTDYHDYLASYIGDRAYDLIPTAQLLLAGATATLSSDWDAGPLPPLGTIERSLTRDANAAPDVETAIELQTINAAYALGHDDTTGSISIGKFADFVILDQDITSIDADKIDETNILVTALAGNWVFQADSFEP